MGSQLLATSIRDARALTVEQYEPCAMEDPQRIGPPSNTRPLQLQRAGGLSASVPRGLVELLGQPANRRDAEAP